jgi:hypothetical protein
MRWGYFPERLRGPGNPISPDNLQHSSLAIRPIAVFPVRDCRERLVGRVRSSSGRRLLEEATKRKEAGHADSEQGQ